MQAPSFIPLNFAILMNPANWFIVVLMLLIFGFVLHLTLPLLNSNQTQGS